VKPWKRDLAYIREVGPDEPRFDEAVQRVWDRCEELEAERNHYRDHSPAGRVSFEDCEADVCVDAHEALS